MASARLTTSVRDRLGSPQRLQRRQHMRRVAGIFFLLLLAFSFSSLAQTTGAIVGFVTDDAGAPLPGATVEARGPALQGTKITVTANEGSYRLPLLPPGPYTEIGRASCRERVAVAAAA